MRLRTTALIATLALGSLAAPLAADAQQAGTVPRIGVLGTPDAPAFQHLWEAFRQGLRDLGYVEGQSIAIESRSPLGRWERLPDLAEELVRLKVDVIVAASARTSRAAKQATGTIPIVMMSGDPIADGLVSSLARPGGNVTGLSTQGTDVVGKELELLKEAIPRLSRVAILWNPNNPFHATQVREAEAAARALGMQLQSVEARRPKDFDGAFSAMGKARVDALFVLADGTVFLQHRAMIADLAARRRLPAMYARREHVEAGGLIAYGADRRELFRRLAVYVDKILKGAKPADLPVEQPTKFELIINLKTAKALGLTIPQSVLFRADHVIQ
ncbi:MAG: ABC transporter substrate-binding protein [Candidatus Rokubacteria bacterium]|nr:ABC transporter substrate-binding protein [Candidatus Rokubacteria bacterium]